MGVKQECHDARFVMVHVRSVLSLFNRVLQKV